MWFGVRDGGDEGPGAVCGGGRPGGGLGTSTGEAKGPREKRGSRPRPAPRGRSAWGRPALGCGRRGMCPHTDALCSVRQRVPRAGRAVVLVRFGLQLCSAAVLCREPPATVGSEGAHVCDVRVGGDGGRRPPQLPSGLRGGPLVLGARPQGQGPRGTSHPPRSGGPQRSWAAAGGDAAFTGHAGRRPLQGRRLGGGGRQWGQQRNLPRRVCPPVAPRSAWRHPEQARLWGSAALPPEARTASRGSWSLTRGDSWPAGQGSWASPRRCAGGGSASEVPQRQPPSAQPPSPLCGLPHAAGPLRPPSSAVSPTCRGPRPPPWSPEACRAVPGPHANSRLGCWPSLCPPVAFWSQPRPATPQWGRDPVRTPPAPAPSRQAPSVQRPRVCGRCEGLARCF